MPNLENDLPIKPGDLVFISIPNALYRRVAHATGSVASHVGIIFADPNLGWAVAESTIPVAKYTPLSDFLSRSDEGWFVIRRLKGGLSSDQAAALRRECDARMGKLYHLGFRYHSQRQFCSKLVYDAYRSAIGIEVGTLETFSELLRQRPDSSLGFWRLWFFGWIPWGRLTVTPTSQLDSAALETVWHSENAASDETAVRFSQSNYREDTEGTLAC